MQLSHHGQDDRGAGGGEHEKVDEQRKLPPLTAKVTTLPVAHNVIDTVATTTANHFRVMDRPLLLSRRAWFGLVPSPADDEPKQYE
ncbi:hypothetical protein GCM10027614_38380 [Micromonospora vulcania]